MSQSVLSKSPRSFSVSYSINAGHELENDLRFDDAGNMVGGADSLRFATIKEGFHILAARVEPGYIPAYTFDLQDMPLSFSFCLSGKLNINLNERRSKRPDSFLNERGVNALISLGRSSGFSRYLSDETLYAVTILLHPEVLEDYWAEEMNMIPEDCHMIMRSQKRLITLPMSSGMHQVAGEAFSPRFQGGTARLHLESCALGLLALQTDHLVSNTCLTGRCLNRSDEERIRAAADMLTEQMADPPTITALACQVGVSESKLRRGFKDIFGLPPLQYLLRHRMNRARELLSSRSLDVSQAASHVGYANVSHFIICYKRLFGVTPGCHKPGRIGC